MTEAECHKAQTDATSPMLLMQQNNTTLVFMHHNLQPKRKQLLSLPEESVVQGENTRSDDPQGSCLFFGHSEDPQPPKGQEGSKPENMLEKREPSEKNEVAFAETQHYNIVAL